MLDSVMRPDYYGFADCPAEQIAQVHAARAQMITVQPFDPSQVGPPTRGGKRFAPPDWVI